MAITASIREADDDADDDDEEEDEYAATADADWEEDAGAAGAEEVEVMNIPESLQRLLRGPCMRSAPTLVTGIEREQTGHGARTVVGCLALAPPFGASRREASSYGAGGKLVNLRELTIHRVFLIIVHRIDHYSKS